MRCRYFLRVPNFSDRSEKFDAQWRSLGGHDVICPFGAENRSAIRAVCQPTTIGDFGFDCRHCFDEQTAPCRLILMQASWSRTMQSLWYQSLCRCVFFRDRSTEATKKKEWIVFRLVLKIEMFRQWVSFSCPFCRIVGCATRRASSAVRRARSPARASATPTSSSTSRPWTRSAARREWPSLTPPTANKNPRSTGRNGFALVFFASYYFASPPQRNFYSFVLLFTFYSRSPNYSRYEPCVIS